MLQVNHLGDRLDAELAVLRGVREEGARGARPEEPFPHSRAALQAARSRLPRVFDWRTRGAVTHVRSECPLAVPPHAAASAPAG